MTKKRLRRAIAIVAAALLLILGFAGATAYYHFAWAGDTEAVTFPSGPTTLSGLLVKPAGNGPHPAIVFLHGSGRGDGSHTLPDYRVHANAFVRRGFLVLVYDKRGIGESQGDFSTATYGNFVEDAVAAVQFLRARDEVEPTRIGLLGTSEGGWLSPGVATRAGGVAFIINKCGSPLSWQETVRFEIENELLADGVAPDAVPQILALRARLWSYYVDATRDGALATGDRRDA